MARVLGINAVFHDPSAALVVDGRKLAAAEEERFSRRKHGKAAVPFSTWELPESAARWCLGHAGVSVDELDAVAYSYDPALVGDSDQQIGDVTEDDWEGLRTLYARRAPLFLQTAPDDPGGVPHRDRHPPVDHPVREPRPSASLRGQAGNADDVLMSAIHGKDWRRRLGERRGRRRVHVTTTAVALAALGAAAARRRLVTLAAGGAWVLLTADFASRRIAPGPRTAHEVLTMTWTSMLIPPLATWHWLRGVVLLTLGARPGRVGGV